MNELGHICPTCSQPLPLAGGLTVDPRDGSVSVNGDRLWMPTMEATLLMALWTRRPRHVPYEIIFDDMYGLECDQDWPSPKILNVYVCNLRRKIKNTPLKIETEWGRGYRLIVEEQKERAA